MTDPAPRRRPSLRFVAAAVTLALVFAGGVARVAPGTGPSRAASAGTARILVDAPSGIDPAHQSDLASAVVDSQLFESLTAIDSSLAVRPALAASWEIQDGGRRVVFQLRPGLTFSDGTPLGARDVVRSWMRVLDPAEPSPLASLLDGVTDATAYSTGKDPDPAHVGITASGNDVVVSLDRPASDFPAIAASPTLAVVPASTAAMKAGPGFVGSGGYVLSAETSTQLTLVGNSRYWAGPPAIGTLQLLTDIGGRSPVQAFQDGQLDYTPIADSDASWIAYDRTLGPQLRSVASLSVDYYGFDTSRPPFSDPRVREAFAMAVDWGRLVALSAAPGTRQATSMVPPGIPGRSATDFAPVYDPAAARTLLAQAGYQGGKGFPTVTLATPGYPYDAGIVRQIRANLGIDLGYETMASADYFARLAGDPPAMWALSWVADYPGPDDFLGLLLGTGAANNYGRWSSAAFDAAIQAAGAATDPAAIQAAFDRAQTVVQHQVPVIPVSYGSGWALSRTGLLGAGENGLGIMRMAGLAWQGGS